MGCWHTKHDINDRHPNIFKVMNVDEQGQLVSPGQLELTDTEMVLYQKGKTSTKWPLAYIRRYGFESELFSFECGRRCPTGPGIYAFRCRRAELLFNLLQERIAFQRTTQPEDNSTVQQHANEFPIPLITSGPAVPIRPSLPDTTGYLEPLTTTRVITRTQSTGFPRLNSISSNGPPTSPPLPITPPLVLSPEPVAAPPPIEHNNNKKSSLTLDHSYSNTVLPPVLNEHEINSGGQYMNVDHVPPISPSPSITSETYSQFTSEMVTNSHLYMNITPGDLSPVLTTPPTLVSTKSIEFMTPNELPTMVASLPLLEEEDQRHCYANLETDEIEGLRNSLKTSDTSNNLLTTTVVNTREVVYAILDLENNKTKDEQAIVATPQSSTQNFLSVTTPDSPNKIRAKGYTIIDFNKTEAVSQIAKPKQDCEGSRKTRHNSTISELGGGQGATCVQATARHSSSLSD
ncbi:fibroblast growth factor receptor substrate 2 isoform X2 [Chrysoperla carnea]|uniref:fibroblast growth factor receptor substrate 2 isoform X2 n=1 Tax=Chrysoperla carnea TaxID=189513 RepID=UPI001D0896DD|nr:fibroblast growth factor receptor substrate 2 isoform X2 [Chrysoperla carnea]